MSELRQEAAKTGVGKMTMPQINAEIEAYRKTSAGKKKIKTPTK